MKLGLLATAAVLALVGGLMVAQVSAQEPSLSVGDGEAAPGDDVTVQVIANVPDGLGAWTLDISYDPDVALHAVMGAGSHHGRSGMSTRR